MAGTQSFQRVRSELDAQGFYQTLSPDCLSLVQALLHELDKRNLMIKEAQDRESRRVVSFEGERSLP